MKKLKLLTPNMLITLSVLTFCLAYQSTAFSAPSDPNLKVKTIKSSIYDAGINIKDAVTVKDKNADIDKQVMERYKEQLKSNHFNRNYQNSKIINLKTEFNFFADDIKIDFAFRDLDVAAALRLLGKEGGKNIVVDGSVKGSINLDLRNVSLNEAMELVLMSQELESRVSGNTIFIASRVAMSKKGLNRRYVKAFKLNNSNPIDIASILESSIFNKGYDLEEKDSKGANSQSLQQEAGVSPATTSQPSGSALPNLSQVNQPVQNNSLANKQDSPAVVDNGASSQSKLSKSKELRSKVEIIDQGSGFNDAGILAAKIKLQGVKTNFEKVNINNNDGGAIVIPDTRTNSVLIAGLKEDIELAAETIKYLDKPLAQISVEVSFIEIKENDYKDLGVSGSINDVGGKSFNVLPDGLFGSRERSLGFAYSNPLTPKTDIFSYNINLLKQKNKVKLLANPTIVTLDGSESLIKITDEILRRMTVTAATNTSAAIYQPEMAEVGIVLNLLPKVSADGNITMRIRPSVTSAGTRIDYVGGFTTPVSTREVILQDSRVKSGQTLAIAGLMKDSEIDSIKKLPGFGELKVFGNLFQNKSFSKEKTELIILITPRILEDAQAN
jgi:type II secretory pathway component GspD/PulD (secretin)